MMLFEQDQSVRCFPTRPRTWCRPLWWCALCIGWLQAAASVQAFSPRDISTSFSAFTSAFYQANGTNAYFKNTQTDGSPTYFWGQAEMIECVIDAYEWSPTASNAAMITNLLNGFISNNGTAWTNDTIYNDDIMWAVMAFARGGLDTGKTNYCNIAKSNFDACYARAWDTTLGGGLWWNTDKGGKNACVNGPGAIAAALIGQTYGDTNYWNKATNIYGWERSVLFNSGSGAIYDNIGTNGIISYWSSTYNQGTFIGAANFLGQTNDAALAARFTMLDLTTGGILPEYGIAGNNSGFNAIFLRWLTRFMRDHGLQNNYEPWLQQNATAAWNLRRSDGLSWCQWLATTPPGTNFYAWDCISSFEALQAALPTQVDSPQPVPPDYMGYWPLDATNGTLANDLSGNGNNGTVNGAVWNPNGRVNGCLVFNGIGSSVQINNPVANDFTIAFWVKTTQTGGAPQWYNGAGLVDGDYPLVANDFGTALVGNKFGFGTGNPDTTLLSTKLINDGVWHQCVATRQEATGTLNVYVDGVWQATTTTGKNTLNASAHLLLGAIASGGGYFNGSLDEVKIYTRALGSNEVAALYNSLVAPPPAAPAGLTATAGNAQVQLVWGNASGASRYNLKRSLFSGGPYTLLTNLSRTSYIDATVTNDRSFFYVVSAVNTNGESTNSLPVNASPLALAAWFKADAITGLVNGASVSVWPDATGNGYAAQQPVSTNQPVYVTGGMNGEPVVRFNSASNSFMWFFRPVQDDFTVICVFQSTQGLGTGNLYYEGAGLVNGEVNGTVNDFGTCLFANGSLCGGTGNPDVAVTSGTGYNNGKPHVLTLKRVESTGGVSLYVDSALVGITTGSTQSLTAPNQLVLGAQQPLDNYFSGDLAEVQIYNSALADADRLGQERALKCKYGVTGGLAPTLSAGLAAAVGNREISLNWPLSPGATSYSLWRSTNDGSSYQLAASGLTNCSYADAAAANGQTNYYKVNATDNCGAGPYTSVLAVWLPLPVLGDNITAGALTVNWPAWANDWMLYGATNLVPPVVWTTVTNPVGSNGGQFNVTLPVGPGNHFFRLGSP